MGQNKVCLRDNMVFMRWFMYIQLRALASNKCMHTKNSGVARR